MSKSVYLITHTETIAAPQKSTNECKDLDASQRFSWTVIGRFDDSPDIAANSDGLKK